MWQSLRAHKKIKIKIQTKMPTKYKEKTYYEVFVTQ